MDRLGSHHVGCGCHHSQTISRQPTVQTHPQPLSDTIAVNHWFTSHTSHFPALKIATASPEQNLGTRPFLASDPALFALLCRRLWVQQQPAKCVPVPQCCSDAVTYQAVPQVRAPFGLMQCFVGELINQTIVTFLVFHRSLPIEWLESWQKGGRPPIPLINSQWQEITTLRLYCIMVPMQNKSCTGCFLLPYAADTFGKLIDK